MSYKQQYISPSKHCSIQTATFWHLAHWTPNLYIYTNPLRILYGTLRRLSKCPNKRAVLGTKWLLTMLGSKQGGCRVGEKGRGGGKTVKKERWERDEASTRYISRGKRWLCFKWHTRMKETKSNDPLSPKENLIGRNWKLLGIYRKKNDGKIKIIVAVNTRWKCSERYRVSLLFSLSSVLSMSLMITRKQLSFLVTYDLFGSGSRGEDGSFSEFVIIITQKIFFREEV